jgi:zinc transport system substrate-binding protein
LSKQGCAYKYCILRYLPVLIILVGCIILSSGLSFASGQSEAEKLKVFVSILPQKFFVEKIAGDKAEVFVLVGPGQSPATYEPLPKQMLALARASLYFRIGVPFETAWCDKIRELNPRLVVIDTGEGIELREIEGSYNKGGLGGDNQGIKDPHIWLDPLLVKIQSQTICRGLSAADPRNEESYKRNLEAFSGELEGLHRELKSIFCGLAVKKIIVFHPAWGYLADRYSLEQIPVELGGREPGPKELVELVELARREGIKVIFVQTQFNTEVATAVAKAIGGKVVPIDPLAEDYLSNLLGIAQVVAKEN